MSFASDTKKEITQLSVSNEEARAELSAIIRMNGTLSISNGISVVNIQTENAAIARRIYSLLKQVYNLPIELLVRKKMQLKKNNVYIVRLKVNATKVLADLNITEGGFIFSDELPLFLNTNQLYARAYLRGAFLASGSVNNPDKASYHMEIMTVYQEHGEALRELFNRFDLNARILSRKKGYIIYLKEAEKITDFLNLIGAHVALMHFEDIRILRDMRNSVNRLVNCETANLNKTISAAVRQIDNIKYIANTVTVEALPDKLREIAQLRVKYPDVSLAELGEMLSTGPISKSGINHRLRKIDQIANRLKAGEELKDIAFK
ncbi:DNA-binding protein WhiA [Brochothrix thermosphacta]|uniref:DNA-binding protein WhiA n=1 Tax=Brochothrix thermosphacta TaxID=2756 RepID=UPI00048DC348|nr:DNA-binding protein WhiA [Brochothrix thermosphacta]ODJ49251.1 DNA-binding protein WhiA [Brochothrix thermosphacta DSM 20171 = FSL F6-1036]